MKVMLASEVNDKVLMVSEIHGKIYVQRCSFVDASITEHDTLESVLEEVVLEDIFKAGMITEGFVEFYKTYLNDNGMYLNYEYAGKNFFAFRHIDKLIELINYVVKSSEDKVQSLAKRHLEYKITKDNIFVMPYDIEVQEDGILVGAFAEHYDGNDYCELEYDPLIKIDKSMLRGFDLDLIRYFEDVFEHGNSLFPDMKSIKTMVYYDIEDANHADEEERLLEMMHCMAYRVTSSYRFDECKYFIK